MFHSMKQRFSILLAALLIGQIMIAQVHITTADPDTWSTEELRPYVNQTVIFDIPIVVSTISGSNYIVGPFRIFQPENQGVLYSDAYNNTIRINSSGVFTLTGAPSGHRTGERIYGLKVKVGSSPNQLSWQGGTWRGNSKEELKNADIRKMLNIEDDCDECLVVCGFNVENYFMTWGSMGAASYEEHQKQRAKTKATLKKINADIYGFCELQLGNEAIKEICGDLNALFPERNYKYFNDLKSGTSQKSDFLYDANKVEPVADTYVYTDKEVAYRKKMVCFRQKSNGERFIFSINHFKAMNTGDEARRVVEAQMVVNLYNSYRQNALVRDNDVLFMGDMNSYAKAKPIQVFTKSGMIDLHRAFHADSSYSYVYSNMAAYIDHALCSKQLYRQVTGMAVLHINSDEPRSSSYSQGNDATMFRSSDHDPVIVGLHLDSTLSRTYDPYINSADLGADSISFYYVYSNAKEEPLVYFDLHTVNGFTVCPPTKIKYNGELKEQRTKYYTLTADNPNLPDELKQMLPLPNGVYILRFFYDGQVHAYKFIVR